MPDPTEDHALTELAARLAALPPLARAPDRDRLLIQMGRASARSRLWPSATLALALLSAGLGWRLVTAEATVVERIVVAPAPAAEVPAESDTPSGTDLE